MYFPPLRYPTCRGGGSLMYFHALYTGTVPWSTSTGSFVITVVRAHLLRLLESQNSLWQGRCLLSLPSAAWYGRMLILLA